MAQHTDGKPVKTMPPAEEWDTLAELFAAVYDRLGLLTVAVQNGYLADPIRHPPAPYPRPMTEIDRASKRAAEAEDHALDDLIAQAHANHRAQLNREE